MIKTKAKKEMETETGLVIINNKNIVCVGFYRPKNEPSRKEVLTWAMDRIQSELATMDALVETQNRQGE